LGEPLDDSDDILDGAATKSWLDEISADDMAAGNEKLEELIESGDSEKVGQNKQTNPNCRPTFYRPFHGMCGSCPS
jgi:hypothetical protein